MSAEQTPLQAEILEILRKSGEPLTRVEIVDLLKHRLDANSHSVNSRLNNLVRALHLTVSETETGRKQFQAVSADDAAGGTAKRRRKPASDASDNAAPVAETATIAEKETAAEVDALVEASSSATPQEAPSAAPTKVRAVRKPKAKRVVRKPAVDFEATAPNRPSRRLESALKQAEKMVPFVPDLYEHVGQSMTDLEDLAETAIRGGYDVDVVLGLVAANATLRRVQNALYRSASPR